MEIVYHVSKLIFRRSPIFTKIHSIYAAKRIAATAAGLRLVYHVSKLTLRVPLVFTKKHGIYAAKLMLRLRLAFAKRTYYTINMAAAKEFYRRKARRAHIFTLRPACALIFGAAGTRCVRQCPRRCL